MTLVRTGQNAAVGCSLAGSVHTSYDALVAAFGEPYSVPSDKVRVEWVLRSPAGIVTVYDWKEYGVPVEDVRVWNVGAGARDAVALVEAALARAALR